MFNGKKKTLARNALAALMALVMLALSACVAADTPSTDPTAATTGSATAGATGTPAATATPGADVTPAPTSPEKPVPTLSVEKLEEYSSYMDANEQFVGVVSIPGTKLEYPVLQPDDDLYYVYYNFEKKQSSEGAIFLGIDAAFPDNTRNMVLHGHNMKDNTNYGKMFGYLHDYSTNKNRANEKGLDYYKEHPLVNFDTIYGDAAYKIFATIYADVSEPEDRKDGLFYYLYNDFASDEEYGQFLTELQRRSLITTTVDVTTDDEILMLSTCDTNGLFKGPNGETLGHFIVIARKVRDGESTDVDVAGAVIAENPLMDQLWYTKGYAKEAPRFDDRDDRAPWFIHAE